MSPFETNEITGLDLIWNKSEKNRAGQFYQSGLLLIMLGLLGRRFHLNVKDPVTPDISAYRKISTAKSKRRPSQTWAILQLWYQNVALDSLYLQKP
jgi:hypothetical protein